MVSKKTNRKSSKKAVLVCDTTKIETPLVEMPIETAEDLAALAAMQCIVEQPELPKKAKWQPDSQEGMFEAVRTDKIVGRGTQCFVDSNVSDERLQQLIRYDWNSYSCGGAVRQARKLNACKGVVMYGPMVKAVRGDKIVGEGSLTTIDEATTDEELIELLKSAGVTTAYGAVRAARSHEALIEDFKTDVCNA